MSKNFRLREDFQLNPNLRRITPGITPTYYFGIAKVLNAVTARNMFGHVCLTGRP